MIYGIVQIIVLETIIRKDKIYVIYDKKLVCEGKTLSVLNEEKLLKRLGISLPFIIDLNKYFMDLFKYL